MNETSHKGYRVFKCVENLNLRAVSEFHAGVMAKLDRPGSRVAFDFSHCRQVDSSGVDFLLKCYRKVKEGNGTLVLVSLPPDIEQTFQIANLIPLVEAVGDLDQLEDLQ